MHDSVQRVVCIGPGLIKEVIEAIVDPLLHIYNLSLNKGIVPDKLKTTKVVPIYKKGDKSQACNYSLFSYVYIYVCVFVCMCVCIYVCIYVCIININN